MATGSMEAVRLPQSGFDFYGYLKSRGALAKFNSDSMKKKIYSPDIQQMINYSHPALKNGRPLNKVMIVLVGQSGAGKSTTINYLFNDEICSVSSSSSGTRMVTEYGKELCVSAESPPVIGTLSFVDLPGALDVDHSKEALNLATIAKFRGEHADLLPRKGLMSMSTIVREQVYPNLVLMSIKSNDNRMMGPNSNFRKCLQALEKYRFLDPQRTNLMIVVTHAMDITTKKYVEKTKETTRIIQEAVLKVLRIHDVQVVFVENVPSDYDMAKDEDCDFYQLPDGQLSHYNLIKAMETHFENNHDVLGKLLCGWYFADNCPEKLNKANVLQSIEHTQLSEQEREKALQDLMSMDSLQFNVQEGIAPPTFDFQFLGRGYCTKSETVTGLTVYADTDTTKTKLLDTLYTIPKCFEAIEVNESSCYPLTSETEEMYEKARLQSYGLEGDVKLLVHVDSKGRWIDDSSTTTDGVVSVVYEKRLLSICIADPKQQLKSQVIAAINLLPPKYNETSAQSFNEFFNKWGSHFVSKVWVGGCIKVDCVVNTSEKPQEVISDIYNTVKAAFSRVEGSGASNADDHGLGFQKYSLSINGGDPPSLVTLNELTLVRFSDWVQSIQKNPAELQYSLQLCPYYIFATGLRRLSLMEATNEYLDGTIPEYLPVRRSTLSPVESSNMAAELLKGRTPSQIKHDLKIQSQVDKEHPSPPPERKSVVHPLAATSKEGETINRIEPIRIKRNQVAENMVENAKVQARRNQQACFPPCAKVYTSNGLVLISQLKPGTKVLTANWASNHKTGQLTQTKFYTYLHYDPQRMEEFLVLHLENSHCLTITGNHLVFINSQDSVKPIQAQSLKPGDELLHVCDSSPNTKNNQMEPVKIAQISTVMMRGVYSPLTHDGTLIVHGVLVSCYAHVESHVVAHASMVPLRLWYRVQHATRAADTKSCSLPQNQPRFGIHKYAEILMTVQDKLPFGMFKC